MRFFKYFLTVFMLFSLFNTVSAQCVPDSTLTKPGIFPDAVVNLDTATANIYYEMVMTAIVPKDTLFFGSRIPIDSIGISKFEGLPAGFTMVANTASAYWKGGSSGCILISGTPGSVDVGVYPLTIQVVAVVAGTPAPYPVPGYQLVVEGNSGFITHDASFGQAIAFPNPFSSQTIVQFSSNNSEQCFFRVYNSNGALVHSSTHTVSVGINNIPFVNDNYTEGLYFYTLTSENLYFANKILIKY